MIDQKKIIHTIETEGWYTRAWVAMGVMALLPAGGVKILWLGISLYFIYLGSRKYKPPVEL